MKKAIFTLLLSTACMFGCKDDDKIAGTAREFFIMPITNDFGWPNKESDAITFTWEVVATGGPAESWSVKFETEPGDFLLTTDYASNRFTVSVPKNEDIGSRSVTVKVDYGDIWRYLDLTQTSSFFRVESGANVGGGKMRYLVNSDGVATYKGEIYNPNDDPYTITFKSGSDIFTVVDQKDPIGGTHLLSFTTDTWTGFFSIGYKEAVYEVKVNGKPQFDSEIIVRQVGERNIPAEATEDPTAPGGFYYKLYNNNIDVAGIDLVELEGKTWDEIFDPNGLLPASTTWNNAPVSLENPCPDGWKPMTLDLANKIIGGSYTIGGSQPGAGSINTGFPANVEGAGSNRAWLINKDGNMIKSNIFSQKIDGTSLGVYYHLMTSSAGAHSSAKQFARITVNESANVTISNAGRATKVGYPIMTQGGSSTTWFGVRCIRERQ